MSSDRYPIRWTWVIRTTIIYFLYIFTATILIVLFTPAGLRLQLRHTSDIPYIYLTAVVVGFLTIIPISIWHSRFKYSLNNESIKLSQGILNPKQREIPYSSISRIWLEAGFWDKIFGLTTVNIDHHIADIKQVESNRRHDDIGPWGLGFSGQMIWLAGLNKTDANLLKTYILNHLPNYKK